MSRNDSSALPADWVRLFPASSAEVSHAYIIEGNRQEALAFARALARHLLSEGRDGSALTEETFSFRDLTEETEEKISIAMVRSLTASLYQQPLASRYRVFLLDYADRMREEAQNALLKSLEEPPAYLVWILVAQNSRKLLATVRSRCRLLFVPPRNTGSILSSTTVSSSTPEEGPLPEETSTVTLLTEEEEKALFGLLRAGFSGQGAAVFDRRDRLLPLTERKGDYLEATHAALADMLQYKSIGNDLIVSPGRRARVHALAEEVTTSAISVALMQIEELSRLIEGNINVTMAWEHFFLHLGRIEESAKK